MNGLSTVFKKKGDTVLMMISLPNLDQFSKFFYWQIL